MESGIVPSSVKERFSRPYGIFFAGLILLGSILFFTGLSAPFSLGDEVHHYRFAQNCFDVKGRALYDSIYAGPAAPGFFYETEVAWPLVLSWIWRLLGHSSFPAAQGYQTFFYALLVLGTFQTARKLYGTDHGLLSALIVATAPMIVSFSILFYIDMPAAALSIWTFYLLLERRYFLTGIVMGIAYLIKKSTGFFVPVIFCYVVADSWPQFSKIFKKGVQTFLPAGALVLIDEIWRRGNLVHGPSLAAWLLGRLASLGSGQKNFIPLIDFTNSSILNPLDAVKYFGVSVLAGICLYFLFRCWEKKDIRLWVFTGFFFFVAFLLRLFPDIRYLMPVVPFLVILAGKGLMQVCSFRAGKVLIIGFGVLQFLSAAVYTRSQRLLPAPVLEGFTFMKENIPKESVIVYPETNLLQYAGRRMVWSRVNLRSLFWDTEIKKVQLILIAGLDYIAVKKTRTYDDTRMEFKHVGQYPVSFLRFLEHWPPAENIFENPQMLIYRINREMLLRKIST